MTRQPDKRRLDRAVGVMMRIGRHTSAEISGSFGMPVAQLERVIAGDTRGVPRATVISLFDYLTALLGHHQLSDLWGTPLRRSGDWMRSWRRSTKATDTKACRLRPLGVQLRIEQPDVAADSENQRYRERQQVWPERPSHYSPPSVSGGFDRCFRLSASSQTATKTSR